MISDVTERAARMIRRYQRGMPASYDDVRGELAAVLVVLDGLTAALDCCPAGNPAVQVARQELLDALLNLHVGDVRDCTGRLHETCRIVRGGGDR